MKTVLRARMMAQIRRKKYEIDTERSITRVASLRTSSRCAIKSPMQAARMIGTRRGREIKTELKSMTTFDWPYSQ
jgi:hypothetical protein